MKALTVFLAIATILVVFYLSFAFVCAEWNPLEWFLVARALFAIIALSCVFGLIKDVYGK